MSKKLRKVKAKLEVRRSQHEALGRDKSVGYRKPGSMNRRKA